MSETILEEQTHTGAPAGESSPFERERAYLRELEHAPLGRRLGGYLKLSGPGWLQSAITLGGGSLAGSLYLGGLGGFALLWVQPVAMILGIIMLSAIGYVTMATGERPFKAINEHVSPVLGWGWLLAALAANMFWCLPQFALATGVIQQNLAPELLGPNGSFNQSFAASSPDGWMAHNAAKLAIAVSVLLVTVSITWMYDSGGWGVKLYERLLKVTVAGIVICFIAVVFAIRNDLQWGELFAGFIPSWSSLTTPTKEFAEAVALSEHAAYWTELIVSKQQDVLIGAAATAVGINMTFLFPYSLLAKTWTKEFRGLAIFDLSTGMLIPYLLATSCVVVAAANQFHYVALDQRPATASELAGKTRGEYYDALAALAARSDEDIATLQAAGKQKDDPQAAADAAGQLQARLDQIPVADRRIAAMLASRDAGDLAQSLSPVTGDRVANLVFGIGVLGMALSTITLLMLISGFCVCEALGVKATGWAHRLGCLVAAVGVLGPFIWSQASFYLAVYVSAFGLMLLPIAYISFLFLMNRPDLLGSEMPRGGRRWKWNMLMGIAASIASVACLYTVQKKLGMMGIGALAAFVVLALVVQMIRKSKLASA